MYIKKGAIMTTNEAKQMPLHEKFHNFCVEVSTSVAVGGGAL